MDFINNVIYAIYELHNTIQRLPASSQLNHRIFGSTENMRKPEDIQRSVSTPETWIIFLLFTGAEAQNGDKETKQAGVYESPCESGDPFIGVVLTPKICRRKRNAANINMRAKIDRFLSF